MKLIYVSGDDFAAVHFENAFGGTPVQDIVDNPERYPLVEHGGTFTPEDEDAYWDLEIKEVGDVSAEFVSFVRRHILDHDDSKMNNFWMENETI